MSALLEVSGLRAWYGASQALFGVDLAVAEGEAVALMGRNGMGKTTTIRAICRMIRHTEGRIALSGTDLARLASHEAAQLGIGLAPEGRRCFPNLTVYENLIVASSRGEWTQTKVERLFPQLAARRNQMANTLSGGEQQMLAIGRALMTNPRLLILDEATEGLAPVVRQEIWSAIRSLKEHGQAILIVDKSLKELLGVATRCFILEKGTNCWTGAAGELTPVIADRYLGV